MDELRAGMVGIGRTVFEGDRLDEFKVHILGVLRNVIGPRRNLILARLEGGPLANTGVIAGMSGSPVYIDGRLVGAVSYSLGQFSKEPIAGITPIDEMIEAATLAASAPPGRARRAADAADAGGSATRRFGRRSLDAAVRRQPRGRAGASAAPALNAGIGHAAAADCHAADAGRLRRGVSSIRSPRRSAIRASCR